MRADSFSRRVCDLRRVVNVTGDQGTWAGVCWQKRVESFQRDQIRSKACCCCCQLLTLAISCGRGTPNQSQSWFLNPRTVARSLSLKHKAHTYISITPKNCVGADHSPVCVAQQGQHLFHHFWFQHIIGQQRLVHLAGCELPDLQGHIGNVFSKTAH